MKNKKHDNNCEFKNKKHNLLYSFINAFNGINIAIKSERNIIIELIFTVIAITACILLKVSINQAIFIIICCVLVLTVELLNSALERVVDLLSPEYHDLAKQAKDLSAGAVLITSIGSAVIGICIFLPKIIVLLFK